MWYLSHRPCQWIQLWINQLAKRTTNRRVLVTSLEFYVFARLNIHGLTRQVDMPAFCGDTAEFLVGAESFERKHDSANTCQSIPAFGMRFAHIVYLFQADSFVYIKIYQNSMDIGYTSDKNWPVTIGPQLMALLDVQLSST